MPRDAREPQSYGSGSDWTTGRTGQEVNDQESTPAPEHRQFYDESRESETSDDGHQGGHTSSVQLAESAENAAPTGQPTGGESPVGGVSNQTGGAKRDSFFKKRDYE